MSSVPCLPWCLSAQGTLEPNIRTHLTVIHCLRITSFDIVYA